ncbi:MAG: MAE_28990/MAE_18760 family HEPN-like nuclease [Bacteroidota bacterium]|nr:MAE_28990/MAE_18760 family HEPN-like nuclease [Bacteroidota bacterium]
MDNTKSNFEKRKIEIDTYIKYLLLLDKDDVELSYSQNNVKKTELVEGAFLTTLTANSFLLLYNVIESTIRNAIIAIYDSIKNEGITFDELSDNLKKLWARYETERFKEGNFKMDTIREFVLDFANKITAKEIVVFSEEWMDFSGNLDANEIRGLAEKIGFLKSPDGRNLVKIKDKRNRLAHGEHTFYDVGKDFTIKEIDTLKVEVFEYLDDVVSKVELFIENRSYKKQ